MVPERPKILSPEEIAEIEKERTITEAEFLKKGAEYKIGEKGEKKLELTEEQIENVRNTEDKETILKFIKYNAEYMRFISRELFLNKEFILEAIKVNSEVMNYCHHEYRSDKEFILAVVKANGMALEYTFFFKDDKDIVLEAVKQNHRAFKFASLKLQNDPDVRKAAGFN